MLAHWLTFTVKESTTIPVPDVLAWSSQSDNPVGADYIITNEMLAVLLEDAWETMTTSQHITCIESVAHLVRKLCTVDFPGYGSLYNLEDGNDDLLAFDNHHGLGPLCKTRSHETERVQDDELRSPTKFIRPSTFSQTPCLQHQHNANKPLGNTLEAYYADRFTKAHSRLPAKDRQYAKLLHIAHKTIQTLIHQDSIRKAGVPLLSHLDLHRRNILVLPENPTVVTGLISWQSLVVEPAYVFAAETPDFADELPDLVIKENSTAGRAYAILKADVEYCRAAWTMVPTICPKFCEASKLDVSVLQLLSAPSHKWLEDAVCVQMILWRIRKKWSAPGLPGECFYQPTREEAEALEIRLDFTRDIEKLKGYISQGVGCEHDGWVAADCWDEVLPQYREMYRHFADGIAEEHPDEDVDALWSFDQR